MQIHPIDFAILALYLVGITLFGAHFRRGQQNLRDYFLGGRSAPWWAIACSIVATETSTLTIIGTPGIAYGGNLGFLQLVLGYLVARVILCIVLVPQYFQGEFYTAYQLLEKRFGARIKSAAAVVFVCTRALAEGVRISAIGKVVSVAFGTGERTSILIIATLTLFYTFEGGMRAVIWTDVIQFALYLAGSIAAFFLLLHKIPGGWPTVTLAAAAAGGKLTIFDFAFSLTKSYTFWSGLLGGTFLTMASHGTDQTMVQRLLASRNERDSKAALLASGVIIFAQFSLFLVLGVMLFVYAQHFALAIPGGDLDKVYPELIVHHMPVGLWGIVLGLLGLIRWGPVLVAGLTIASITYGATLGVFLLGTWNRRANETGALVGFVTGLVAMVAVRFLTPLAWTWYVLVGTVITFAVGSLASVFATGASKKARAQQPL